METTEKLARAFGAVLADWLSEEQRALVIARNLKEGARSPICHTHDFCDPNQAMLDTFEQVLGREMVLPCDENEKQSDADMVLSQAAWNMAKAAGFWWPAEKEARHLIVEVDPRDACLDEIAELLRGEVGADEIAEISRIVESSGRHIGSESERLEKEAYARERMGSRRLPGGHG